jgi:SAM-dependent methyltransferase
VESVVDVGCGNGANLAALQQQLGLRNVVGLDVSDAAIRAAKARVKGQLLVRDVIAEGGIEGRYDLVLSSQVIEHIEDDETFVQRLYDMCGRYCFLGTMQGRMRSSELEIGHQRNYTREGLVGMMEAAGFKTEQVIEWGFPFYSPLYRSAIERFGAGASQGVTPGRLNRLASKLLHNLYKLNSHSHGDVIMVLASRK